MVDILLDILAELSSLSLPAVLFLTVLVPTILLAFAGRKVRIAMSLGGLATAFVTSYLMDLGGPDSLMLIIPLLGLISAFDAMLAEVAMAVIMNRRNRRAQGAEGQREL